MPYFLLFAVAGVLLMTANKTAKKNQDTFYPGQTSDRDTGLSGALDDVVNQILGPIAGLPRGLRANNPLNIREAKGGGDEWQGEAPEEIDSAFEEFIAPEYGYRAAAKIIASYRRRGLQTVAEIIGAWAPSNENDTANYIRFVSQQTGLPAYWPVSDGDLPPLLRAMAIMENGAKWAGHPSLSLDTIRKGVALA